jgi:hypothetical protein
MTDTAPTRIRIACPTCGKGLGLPPHALGRQVRCPGCSSVFTAEAAPPPSAEASRPTAGASQGTCIICQSEVHVGEPTVACPDCRTTYHGECWDYNQGCGQYGCAEAPPTQKLEELEMPASYWGAQDKACPRCGQTILAAAVRCRFCGTTFESAQPQEARQFQEHAQVKSRVPAVRAQGVWLLVFSILTCTAPIAAIVGLAWYSANRQVIAKLSPLSAALCKIAVGVACVQTMILVLVAVLYTAFSGA